MSLFSLSFSDESENEDASTPSRLSKESSTFLCQSNDDFLVFSPEASASNLNVQFSGGVLKWIDYYKFEFLEDSNERFVTNLKNDTEIGRSLELIKQDGSTNTVVGLIKFSDQSFEIFSDNLKLCASISMYGVPINEYNNAKISIEILDIIDSYPKLLHNIDMFDNGISRVFSFGSDVACIIGRESSQDVYQLQCMIPISSYLLFGIVVGFLTFFVPRKITSHRSGCFVELPLNG